MKKIFWLPAIIAIAAVSVIGVTSFARADHGGTGSSDLSDRVAEILNIAPEDVSAAIAQARSEAHVARIESRLAEAVAAGVISEEESAVIFDWVSGKPEALHSVKHYGLKTAENAGEVDAILAELVAQELISESESAEISAWLAVRPAATDSLREWRRSQFKLGGHHGHGGCGRGHHRHLDSDDTSGTEVSDGKSA